MHTNTELALLSLRARVRVVSRVLSTLPGDICPRVRDELVEGAEAVLAEVAADLTRLAQTAQAPADASTGVR